MEGVVEPAMPLNQQSDYDLPECDVKVGCEDETISATSFVPIAYLSLTDDETGSDEERINSKTQHKMLHSENRKQMQPKNKNAEFFESDESLAHHSAGYQDTSLVVEKNINCDSCNRSFTLRRYLLRHIKLKHLDPR